MTTHRIVLSLAVVMSMGCNSFAAKPAQTSLSQDARLVACGNNCFALQLYQKLQGQHGNLFFSPYSISTALAMTYAGAKGRTQEQMAQVLCFPTSKDVVQKLAEAQEPLSPEEFARAFGEIVKDLNARGGQGKYELRVANALWGQQDYEFLASFAKLVESQYGGHLERVNFVQAAEKARRTINAWVEKQTNGKIKDLIGQGVLDSMTRLVLTNAIYFKGNWATPVQEGPDHGRAVHPARRRQGPGPHDEPEGDVRLRRDRYAPGARNALRGPGTLDGRSAAEGGGRHQRA